MIKMKSKLCTIISSEVIDERTAVTAYQVKGSGKVIVTSSFNHVQSIGNALTKALKQKISNKK